MDSSAAIEFWPTTSAQASGCRTALHDPSFAPGVRDRMRKLGLVGAVLVAVGCGGGSSRPLGNGSGSGGGSPDGGDTASVSLNIAIAGKGSVTVEGLSINCSASCAQAVASGSAVHLDATPASGMVFSGWSGACTGTGGCDLTLTQDAAVTATFAPAPPSMVTLAVQVVGSGSGRIVSSPTGIDCPGTCAMEIASGTPVTLNSAANPGSSFDGFGGGCSGLHCASSFSANTTVYANFSYTVVTPVLHTLSVSVTGGGTVTSQPVGISCLGACSAEFADGTTVALTATPGANLTLTGWGGACSGTGACNLTLSADASVIATFGAATPPDSCAGLMPTMPAAKTAMLSAYDVVPDTCGYAISDGSSNLYMQSPYIQSQNFFVPLQVGYTAYSHQMSATGTFYAYAPDGAVVSSTMYGPAAVPGMQANGGVVVVNATCNVSSTASARYIDDSGHVAADVALPGQPCNDWTSPQLAAIVDAQNRLFLLSYGAGGRGSSTVPAGNSTARWFDSSGKALTPWFDVGVVDSSYPVYPVFPLIGGGVALRNGDVWVSTVASGAATPGPAPKGFESGKLALVVRGGKAYAMEPYRYGSGSIDVIAPDGKNCGTLTTQSGYVAVGRDGSILVVPPNGRDRTTNLCPVTWYPQVLK